MRNGVSDLEDVLELEDGLLRTYYFEAQEVGRETARRDPRTWLAFQSELFELGRDVLVRKQQYRSNARGSREPVAEELVEIGDWHLLFGRNRQALEQYRSARASLIDQGKAIDVVDGIFSPNVPAILPLFESRMSSPVRSPHGYIDVTVDLSRYGRATEVEVIGGSADVSTLVEQRLRRHILSTQFRPRFVDGKLARSDRVRLRCYFSYSIV